ncbi:MAG: DctP family TRAP transporter solute-binding subunit [Synergistaceae bacterium]|jgi:tripartite ATP-independent transporter DctP family solute receptor|nr:DctP family TRAP transporter solute-binding subunit [Synergistaceae bacterium]
MKKILFAMLFVAFLASSLTCPVFAAEPRYKGEYKLSVNISEVTPMGKAVARFARQVREKTDGRVNIKVYWNGQLFSGKATNELLLMKNNVGDFSLSSFINWAPQFTEGNLFLLPWFISSMPDKYKALDAVTSGKAGEMIAEKVANMNLRILAWGEQGTRELTNNIRPVRTPAELNGLKIRVVGSPLFIDIFNALGANPMNISWAEAITALQQNTVDGQENPYAVYLPNKIYEFQKYLTEWSYNMDPLIYVVHQKVWDSFPEDVRTIVSECAREAGIYNRCLSRLGLDDGSSAKWLKANGLYPPEDDIAATNPRAFVESKGVQVTLLTQEEIRAFADIVAPVREKWIPKIGRDLVKAAEEDMDNAAY